MWYHGVVSEDNEKIFRATQVNTAAIMATDRLLKQKIDALHDEILALRDQVEKLEDRVEDCD